MARWWNLGRGVLIVLSALAAGLAVGLLAHLVGWTAVLAVAPGNAGPADDLPTWLVFTAPTLAGIAAAVAVGGALLATWRGPVTPPG